VWRYGSDTGRPLLLVHGFRGDHHGLEGIAETLAQRAPELSVYVPDLPGFGETPPVPGRTHDLGLFGEWLRALTAGIVPEGDGFAILGHSFGSLVVANSLSQGLAPTRTVLVNPISAPALEGPQAVMTKLAIAYYRAADALPEGPSRALLGNPLIVRVMSEFMAKTGDRELRSWIHDQHDRYFSRFSDSSTLLEAFRASVSHTVIDYADALDMPTLLIAGDRDDITPLDRQLVLARRLPAARLRVVPHVGHLVHYEAVDYAADEMLEFLRAGEGA
jgi:pimeloyl-ACP methyl ester carboxylesterase